MPEILTPKEVAAYLKMSVLTVYKHAKQGTLPAFRIGNSWRFEKKKIDEILLKTGGVSKKTNTSENERKR